MRRRVGWALLPAGVMLGLIVVSAPLATAAESTVRPEIPDEVKLDPGARVNRTIQIVYSYSGTGTTGGEVEVSLSVRSQGPLANAEVVPSSRTVQVDDSGCQCGTAQAWLHVTVRDDADAFRTGSVTVTANAADKNNVEGSQGSNSTAVQVRYVPDLVLEPQSERLSVHDQRFNSLRVKALNRGNGPVRVQFLRCAPEDPDRCTDGIPPLEEITRRSNVEVVLPETLQVSPGQDTFFDLRAFKASDGPVSGNLTLRADYWFWNDRDLLERTDPVSVELSASASLPPIPWTLVGAGAAVVAVVAGAVVWWFRYR